MTTGNKQDGAPFKVRYGSGTVQGFFAQDDMEVAGFSVRNQSFAEVTDASGLGRTYQVRSVEKREGEEGDRDDARMDGWI